MKGNRVTKPVNEFATGKDAYEIAALIGEKREIFIHNMCYRIAKRLLSKPEELDIDALAGSLAGAMYSGIDMEMARHGKS